ncbi:MAG: DUF2304 domain-containing protein [Opitutae bacterium]|nr:DUF2304 domain-containing protein [Opitutae bacterium]
MTTLQTKIVLILFFLVYLSYLTRSAARNHIDIYDYFALSCVALLPLGFGLLPVPITVISHWMGVTFPFVVLFGALFVVIFVYLHRLLNQLNRQTQFNKQLVQEISLLKAALESGKRADPGTISAP